ncbi:2-hydroxyacid dehydrogenase [Methylocella sp.]|uniref:2-hydroxyacid dehydrogenase n=1 Tax=Methylocella sp. TaxID=1978226 RepID=UPI0037849472
MKAMVFDAREYDRASLNEVNARFGHDLRFQRSNLDHTTAALARGVDAVIPFVNDSLDEPTLRILAKEGVRLVAMRCAGHNNLDCAAARRLGLRAVNVPAYSPHAVAEHVFALLLGLVRNVARARERVRDGNFSIEGLSGFNLYGKTFGLVGMGHIGLCVAQIARGVGCRVIAHDPYARGSDLPAELVELDRLLAESDVVSLHAPLTKETRHLIDAARLSRMKPGAVLINTSRGALVDTAALIDALKERRLGGVGLDVYEEEAGVFYHDLSNDLLDDDVLARLLMFRNVLVTSHMGFLTREALRDIAEATLGSLSDFEAGRPLAREILRD